MDDNILIRPLEKSDLNQIIELHLESFHAYQGKSNLEILKSIYYWKYYQNPIGDVRALVAVDTSDQLLGLYAGIPLKLKVSAEETNVIFGTNIMVREKYRKTGIFKQLYNSLHQSLSEEGRFSAILGYPNILSYEIGKHKFNFPHYFKIHRYIIPIRSFNLEINPCLENGFTRTALTYTQKLINKLNVTNSFANYDSAKKYSIIRFSGISDDVHNLWQEAKSNYEICFVRDKEILEWRFLKTPIPNIYFYEVRKGSKLIAYFSLKQEMLCTALDFLYLKTEISAEDMISLMAKEASHLNVCDYLEISTYDSEMERFLARIGARSKDISHFCGLPLNEDGKRLEKTLAKDDLWYLTGSEFTIG